MKDADSMTQDNGLRTMKDDLRVDLTDEQVGLFREKGFLRLGRVTTPQEIEWLSGVYDQIVKQRLGVTPEEMTHRLLGDQSPEALVTFLSPEGIVPALKDTLFARNARTIIARLFGVEEAAVLAGWRLFFKPAHGAETPWHQDAAYRPPPHRGGSVWMSLDPATVEDSCLHYIGGSHLGDLRAHYLHHHHLKTDDLDPAQAVACPVAPGEATAHHCKTLHGAGPNQTGRPRRALVIVCQVTGSA